MLLQLLLQLRDLPGARLDLLGHHAQVLPQEFAGALLEVTLLEILDDQREDGVLSVVVSVVINVAAAADAGAGADPATLASSIVAVNQASLTSAIASALGVNVAVAAARDPQNYHLACGGGESSRAPGPAADARRRDACAGQQGRLCCQGSCRGDGNR